MHCPQVADKDKQIEYINQYYDQLRQEKQKNKKVIEEAIRRQNFECDQVQNVNPLSMACKRDIEPLQNRIPIRHQEPDQYPAPVYPRFEPTTPEYPVMTSQPIQYQDQPTYHQKIDSRYLGCSGMPHVNYNDKPTLEQRYEIRPDFNQFPRGDHQYVLNPQPNFVQCPFAGDCCAPTMHCGDQNPTNFNRNSLENVPCTCQSGSRIPVRIIPTIKNRTDELQIQDLRNKWLNTYNTARLERKNNIKNNR